MKEKLIEKYGEKQADLFLNKFTEEEIYENGILEKELPNDDKWKQKFLELEQENKNLKEENSTLQDLKSKANNESAERRKELEKTNLTKQELEEKLALLELDLQGKEKSINELNEFKQVNQSKLTKLDFYEDFNLKRKEELLSKVADEKKRDALSKLENWFEIEPLLDNTPNETFGVKNSSVNNDSPEKSIMQLANRIFK